MKGRKGIKLVAIIILIAAVFFTAYKYGYRIPVLKEIPFFSEGHEHQWRPVLTKDGEIDYWTCAMHPSVRMKEPGHCPICGMKLVPVMKKTGPETEPDSGNVQEEAPTDNKSSTEMGTMDHSMQGMEMPAPETGKGESRSQFTVSPERQQLIGVKTEPVAMRFMDKTIRTVGRVTLDETKITQINTKFSGWIDKLYVDYTLQHVNKGDPLFSIYSPELVSTEQEYLLALRSNEILSDSDFPEISVGANSLLDATKKRLQLWDISESQISELAKTGKVKKSLIIYSPVSGAVIEKNAFQNMYVEPNTALYKIADHSNVWVEVDIYENEIPLVKLGDHAVMTLVSFPGEEFHGRVTFITPHLDMKTRTAKARLEFPNPDLKLLPEMYTDVNIDVPLGDKLTIPESAVLRTGAQDIVFVDKGEGNMEIKRVELGQKSDGYYEVLAGLSEGEKVVSRANFLIDSESKIQAAVASWNGGDKESESKKSHEGH